MRSCFMSRRILPVAWFICFSVAFVPRISIAENRNLDQNDISSLLLTDEDQEHSSDLGLQSANILLDVIERILDRLETSAVPPVQETNDILQSAPETSWPTLENDFLSRDVIYLPKSSSSSNTVTLGITSIDKSRQREFAPCNEGLCRVIRGRRRGNANAGARMLPFGKRSNIVRNSEDSGTSSVRGRRRGRGRPRSRGSFPPQKPLPFGKRRL